jgi:hypothetical protein
MTKDDLLVAVDRCFFAGSPESVEVEFRVLQAVSDRAQRLLSRADDLDVVFKKSTAWLESDDLVAFANSKHGGSILVGVHETRNLDGWPTGALAGCAVGDPERRKILAKANQCVPPVPVSIFVENRAERPFYRIEIPSGPRKPYCTAEGIYKIRNSGRSETLYPRQLLALFLETNGEEILRRAGLAPVPFGAPLPEIEPPIAVEGNQWSQAARDRPSRLRGLPPGRVETALRAESDAANRPEPAAECGVRLSSQDLCGFLMRIT